MFGIFKKKTEKEKLQKKYEQLMKEAFNLSKINRAESDKKYAEAEKIIQQINEMKS